MKEMYLVMIATGSYDDYYENPKFVTDDKDATNEWVSRFNKIINDNRKRIMDFVYDGRPEPLWFGYIRYDDAKAFLREVPYRK